MQWEIKYVKCSQYDMVKLEHVLADGWEPFAVYYHPNDYQTYYYFKRKVNGKLDEQL